MHLWPKGKDTTHRDEPSRRPRVNNKKRGALQRAPPRTTIAETKLLEEVNGFFDVAMGLVNVQNRTLLEALCEAVVLFLANVAMRLIEQFQGAMQAAGPRETGVHRRMIVQILAVVDARLLDFGDGVVDFMDGLLFLVAQLAAIGTLQMGAGVAQIG